MVIISKFCKPIYAEINTNFESILLINVPGEIEIGLPYNPLSPWWRHQMETFSALLAICVGNSPVPGELPAQRPVTRSFDTLFYLPLNIYGWVNNRETGDLRSHRAHYDVTVMTMIISVSDVHLIKSFIASSMELSFSCNRNKLIATKIRSSYYSCDVVAGDKICSHLQDLLELQKIEVSISSENCRCVASQS